jgi:hypothetical protein
VLAKGFSGVNDPDRAMGLGSKRKFMKNISRFFAICIAGLAIASVDVSAATSWAQSVGGTHLILNSPYSGSSGANYWSWTNSGTLTSSRTTTRVQTVATNFLAKGEAGTSGDNGGSAMSESGYCDAYSWWSWTGTPGASTAVGVRATKSVAKDPSINYGIISLVLSVAPSAGTSADGYAYTEMDTDAYTHDGTNYIGHDSSQIFAEATGSEIAGARDWDFDLDGSNATFSNSHLEDIYNFTRVYSDYSVSLDHSYNTAAGLSSFLALASISFQVYCYSNTDGIPPFMGVNPNADSYGRLSINGSVAIDLTF